MAEFALILPVILLVSLGIMDFGRILITFSQVSFQIREALRYGALTQEGATPHYTQCNDIYGITRKLIFAYNQDVTVRFQKNDSPLDNPTYIYCIDEIGGTPGVIIAANDVEQYDMLQIISRQSVQMLSPFFPAELTFTLQGQRSVVSGIALSFGPDDRDNDGLSDTWECEQFGDTAGLAPSVICDSSSEDPPYDPAATKPARELYDAVSDPDIDGCNNGCEEVNGTDPEDADTDDDGLTDGEEIHTYGTLPITPDTDGDDLWDKDEITGCTPSCVNLTGTNPGNWDSNPRTIDSDGDGVTDFIEVTDYNTDPLGVPTIPSLTLIVAPEGAGSICTGLAADRYVTLQWTPITDPLIEGYWILVNGQVVGNIPNAAADHCVTQNGVSDTCFTELTYSWNPPALYTYEVYAYFGTVTGASASVQGRCTPVDIVTNVQPAGCGFFDTCSNTEADRYCGLTWDWQIAEGYYVYADVDADPLNGTSPVLIGQFVGSTNTSCGPSDLNGDCWNQGPVMDPAIIYTYYVVAYEFDAVGPLSNPVQLVCDNPPPP